MDDKNFFVIDAYGLHELWREWCKAAPHTDPDPIPGFPMMHEPTPFPEGTPICQSLQCWRPSQGWCEGCGTEVCEYHWFGFNELRWCLGCYSREWEKKQELVAYLALLLAIIK